MIRSVPRIVELFKPASGLQGEERKRERESRGKGFSKARKSGAIGREFKLDFVLPRRYKNLKRGGKRGQTSSILSELPESFFLTFSALFLSNSNTVSLCEERSFKGIF